MIYYIILLLLALIVTAIGILVIKVAVQMYEQLYWHKPKSTFKEEAKKRYERKYATKRIQKTNKKV